MDYNNRSLDPESVEYFCPNRPKSMGCPVHTQQVQHKYHAPGYGPHQAHQPYKHMPCQGIGGRCGNPHIISTGDKPGYHSHSSQHGQSKMNVEHFHPSNIRYRSSVSPVQAASGSCSVNSSHSTLTSGYYSGGSSKANASAGAFNSVEKYKPERILCAADLKGLLVQRLALLPGGRSRRGGPILCFPSNSQSSDPSFDELCTLVDYLSYLPGKAIKKMRFDIIIDMRHGRTIDFVKFILKVRLESISYLSIYLSIA